jgi:very-short-patch-repair endonuclease
MTDHIPMPFKALREHYARELPAMMAEYEATGRMTFDPYQVNFLPYLTPIEEYTWQAIRRYGVPFYPQIPALGYFLDFANPFLKIDIECDGKQWHDREKDAIRDTRLMQDGWTVYRIPGWKCNKVIEEPWERFHQMREKGEYISQEEYERYSNDWFLNTVDGLVMALGLVHFGKSLQRKEYMFAAELTLDELRSEVE